MDSTAGVPAAGEAPIVLVPYDPAWQAMAEAERVRLLVVLEPWLTGPIEHIGSTAIPDFDAKPVIDLMAAVRSLQASRPAIRALTEAGYVYFPYRPKVMHWFCRPSAAFRTHHLHLVPLGSDHWVQCLTFRDRLRRDPTFATEYAALKNQLAARFRDNREAYTDGKASFIQRTQPPPNAG